MSEVLAQFGLSQVKAWQQDADIGIVLGSRVHHIGPPVLVLGAVSVTFLLRKIDCPQGKHSPVPYQ